MPIIGASTSQVEQVRYISSGTSAASGSTYTLANPTRAGDVIVFTYTNAGAAPTLTSSTTGITWTASQTTGGSPPQPVVLLGYNANAGITSFNVSGTTAGGGGYCILLISGLRKSSSPVITTSGVTWPSSGTGGVTGTMNLSGNSQVLLLGAAAEFGSQTLGVNATASGYAVNQRAISNVTRTILTVTSQATTGASAETMAIGFNAAQTGGLLVLALAHS